MGKTTTIYATLNALKGADRLVMTYETPIKARIDGVEQVDPSLIPGLDPLDGYRALINQNADILMLGDSLLPRGHEDRRPRGPRRRRWCWAASTGAADSDPPRMTSQGISAVHLASALAGVLGQRLTEPLAPAASSPRSPRRSATRWSARWAARSPSSTAPPAAPSATTREVRARRASSSSSRGKALQRLLLQNVSPDRIEAEAHDNGLELLVKDRDGEGAGRGDELRGLHAAL